MKKQHRRLVGMISLMALCFCAQAGTVIAICSGPTGYNTMYSNGEFESERDSFGDGRFTYIWKRGEDNARVYAVSGQKSGSRKSVREVVAVSHPGFISMVEVLPAAIWTHGLHIQDGVVFITRQLINNSGMPTASTFSARCSITER